MARSRAGGVWRVWVDTGGTFTDCVAVDSEGEVRRAKVLSSSALRARVLAVEGARVRVEPGWEVPEGFFAGCTVHRLGGAATGGAGGGWEVAARDGERGELTLGEVEQSPASVNGGREAASGATPGPRPGERIEIRSPDEAPVLAARLVTGTPHGRSLPPMCLRLATTRGTNALLERRGADVALFVTEGFGDLLEIGTQQRPDLFALEVVKPRPLYRRVVEVAERLDAEGKVLRELDGWLDGGGLERAVAELREAGIGSVAVALLHSYRAPEHERRLGERLRAAGMRVAESAALAPLIKLLPRAETAVVEAYLAPVLEAYLDGVAGALAEEGTSLHVMTSAGGLVRRPGFRAKDGLLSGPAGGVAGAARAGRRAGFTRLLGFDMGGTSTDVSRYDGDFEYVFEHRVGDARLVAPALAIETVAAGGGSVCTWDGDRLRVGPESAGARPGPACYGGGGPLTLTDVNLLLGLLDPERFGIPVDTGAAEAAFDAVFAAVRQSHGSGRTTPGADMERTDGERSEQDANSGAEPSRDELLEGFRAIADERMAEAIRSISVRRGYDPGEYALVAFGGAGGQHACAVAERLGVSTVLVPPDAGLLSALGLGYAVVERFAQRQVLRPLDELDAGAGLAQLLAELEDEAVAAVRREEGKGDGSRGGDRPAPRRGVPGSGEDGPLQADVEGGRGAHGTEWRGGLRITVRRRILHLRFAGQESTSAVELEPGAEVAARSVRDAFAAAYRARYGYLPEDRELEVESARVVASTEAAEEDVPPEPPEPHDAEPAAHRAARFAGGSVEAAVFERAALATGARFTGPALVYEAHGATVVPPGWAVHVDAARTLVARHLTA